MFHKATRKTTMKRLIAIATLMLLAVGCSHNMGSLVIGEKLGLGSPEYGNFTWVNGLLLFDCPRENSYWEIELDSNIGVSFDKETNTIRGVKRIRRVIGRQVTGYLKDVAKYSPDAVGAYLDDETVLPFPPEGARTRDGQGKGGSGKVDADTLDAIEKTIRQYIQKESKEK